MRPKKNLSTVKGMESVHSLNNHELSKELARLKIAHAKLLQENRNITVEKMNLEIKLNNANQLLSSITTRGRTAMQKMVETSNDIAYIFNVSKNFCIDKNATMNNLLQNVGEGSNSQKINNTHKQVVLPHAVNGHVIHTPTIRLSRFNGSSRDSVPETGNQTDQENEENLNCNRDSSERFEENGEEEDSGDESGEIESSNLNGNTDENSDESNEQSGEENLTETNQVQMSEDEIDERLNTILEVSEEQYPLLSSRRLQNVTSNDFSVSLIVEPSTSFDGSIRLNESNNLSILSRKSDSPLVSKRKSFIQRKSIGSPIPNTTKRKSIGSKRRISNHLNLPSTSANNSNNSGNVSNTNDVDETPQLVTSLKSFMEANSAHSTPLMNVNERNPTRTPSRVNIARRGCKKNIKSLEPVVILTNFKFSAEEMDNKSVELKRKSNVFKECEESDQRLLTKQEIKREKSSHKTAKGRRSRKSSVKRSPREAPKQSITTTDRPKRAAAPQCLIEPSLSKKLRRSR